ncbi:hypothetical protein KM043_006247 [Ampulex compressa]|nr:hypothetical protein KM043_006247 [Ampulex compressa]
MPSRPGGNAEGIKRGRKRADEGAWGGGEWGEDTDGSRLIATNKGAQWPPHEAANAQKSSPYASRISDFDGRAVGELGSSRAGGKREFELVGDRSTG